MKKPKRNKKAGKKLPSKPGDRRRRRNRRERWKAYRNKIREERIANEKAYLEATDAEAKEYLEHLTNRMR